MVWPNLHILIYIELILNILITQYVSNLLQPHTTVTLVGIIRAMTGPVTNSVFFDAYATETSKTGRTTGWGGCVFERENIKVRNGSR